MDENQVVALIASRLTSLNRELYRTTVSGVGPKHLLTSPSLGPLPELAAALSSSSLIEETAKQIEEWKKQEIEIIAYGERHYPLRLAEIYDPPLLLFVKGSIGDKLNSEQFLSVVGSRRAGHVGCRVARRIAEDVARAGSCIVSGLAFGIDAEAHRGALDSDNPLPTIAVLGNGLSKTYPVSHTKLAEQILERGGGLISQFEPDMKPYPVNFLNRNRLIAALSIGTLVIEAPAQSGSLATARHALENGREVMVVPGSVEDPRYDGSNELLKKGAYLVTSSKDVFEVLPQLKIISFTEQTPESTQSGLSEIQRKILKFLKANGAAAYSAFFGITGDSSALATELTELEIQGLVQRLPGNVVDLSSRG